MTTEALGSTSDVMESRTMPRMKYSSSATEKGADTKIVIKKITIFAQNRPFCCIFALYFNFKDMSLEIERKFLVVNDSYRQMAQSVRSIEQAYISTDADATVRVRLVDGRGFITVKSRNRGAVRHEWEYEISSEDARQMLDSVCRSGHIAKHRYVVDAGSGLRWEVDEFHGALAPLVVAEIELPSENTPFHRPPFIGEEVTGDPRYFNSNLAAQV